MTNPVQMIWYADDECLRPASPFWARRAAEKWGDGEVVSVDDREERSTASHNHLFAAIKETWDQLPDDGKERHPSPEHLRAWALIKAGYHTMRDIVCASESEARRFAAFVQPIDPYKVVVTKDGIVRVYSARSISRRSMDAKEFQRCKTAVLDVLADLIGVSADDLQKNAGQAA